VTVGSNQVVWDIDFLDDSIKSIYKVYGEYFDIFDIALKKQKNAPLWKITRFIMRQRTIPVPPASARSSGDI
jgi:hypothetical protein